MEDDIVLAGGRTLPRSASQRVLELAGAGKTHMQIAKNYTLADYDLGADDVKFVLEKMPATEKPLPSESPRPQMTRLGNPTAAPAASKYEAGSHSGEKLGKTYSPSDLKAWMDAAKSPDCPADILSDLLRRHKSLLNSVQGGIGNSALHWASAKDNYQIVSLLMSSGAAPDVRNGSGATPLHSAAGNGCRNSVREILELAPSSVIDLTDEEGRTPLELSKVKLEEAEVKVKEPRKAGGGDDEEARAVAEDAKRKREAMADIVSMLELPALAKSMSIAESPSAWGLLDMRRLMTMAGETGLAGLVERRDWEDKCKEYLTSIPEGKVALAPRIGRYPSSQPKPRASDAGPTGRGGTGGGRGGAGAGAGFYSSVQHEDGGRDPTAAELKEMGNKAFAAKEYVSAVEAYEDALDLEPDNKVLLSNLSAAELAMGRYKDALGHAEAACRIDPGWAKAHSRKGCALQGLGMKEEAIQAYKEVLRLEPGNEAGIKAMKRLSGISAKEGKMWVKAARKGDVGAIREMLEGCVDKHRLLQYGGEGTPYGFHRHTALHWCAARGHIQCMEALIAARADVGAKNRGGSTALHSAAQGGQLDAIKALVACGSDFMALDLGGCTPQVVAVRCGQDGAAEYLGSSSGQMSVDESGTIGDCNTGHHVSEEKVETGKARDDAQAGANEGLGAGAADGNRLFALHRYSEAVDAYTLALSESPSDHTVLGSRSGAYLALNDSSKALEDARRAAALAPDWPKGHALCAKAYLTMGDLHHATMSYRKAVSLEPGNDAYLRGLGDAEARLKELADEFVDLPSDDEDEEVAGDGGKEGSGEEHGKREGEAAADTSVGEQAGSAETGEELQGIAGGSHLDVSDVGGKGKDRALVFEAPKEINFEVSPGVEQALGRAYIAAAKNGDQGGVERMLLNRPDLLWYRGQGTSAGFVGHSALHYAAAKGHLDILMMLLASGSDVGARNRGGTTPLHSAAMNDHGQIVTILLRCGADPYVGDQDGERAEEGARRRGKMSGSNAIATFRSGGRVEGVDAVCAGSRQAEQLKAWVEKFEKAKRGWLSSGKHAEVQEAARDSAAAACAAAAEANQDKSVAGKGGGLATNKGKKKEGSGGAEKAGGGKESAGGAQDDSSSSSDDEEVDYAEKIAAMKQKGNAAFTRGEYTAAIGAYSMAVSCSKMSGAGGHYILLSNRSAAYCGAGNYEKALADAEVVVESEPGWAKGYSRLGAALHGCARWAEAAKAYGKGLKIAPDDVKLREGLEETIARVREATGTEPTWLMQDA